ncbi:MAG: aromatic amino acid ammonia-lyase [Steroidobacteraceae bacterium]
MNHKLFVRTALPPLLWTCIACSAAAGEAYRPITASMSSKTITLTGHDLTIEQVVDIARHGAKVRISEEAMQRGADSFGLMLEAQHEGIAVYRFNRLAGSGREIATMSGDPDTAENTAKLAARHDARSGTIGQGPFAGFGEDMPDEDIGRAMLAVNANIVTYEAASPAYIKGIVDLLNDGVTPAVHWRGAIGESDFVPVAATLTGRGFAYFKGLRMPAAEALAKAGLKPIHLEGNDEALGTTSALSAGFAALLVNDAGELLEWHDLIWAMDLEGMNGNVGPLSMPVQSTRPFPWANFAALRVLDMLRGSYLFDDEYRILQDAESMRATVWRDGGVWAAWARLRDSTLIQMNSTDHNPTVRPDISPQDSWELATPQLMKFFVKGGKFSHGKHGYILSNSDWDPYPLVNDVEALPVALVNLMVVVVQRMHRFEDPFFTVTDAAQVLKTHPGPEGASGTGGGGGGGMIADALWQELKPLANPIPPDGVTADKGVGDLDAVPMLKLMRMRQALDVSRDMLGQDLLNAAFWMDLRKLENPQRTFGPGPTAVWSSFRKIVPFREPPAQPSFVTRDDIAAHFLQSTSPASFYPTKKIAMPADALKAIP